MVDRESGTRDAAGAAMKARLRGDLRAAMAARRTSELRVIRELIAAIDDAEAPPLVDAPVSAPPAGHHGRTVQGTWRPLGAHELRLLFDREAEERERAADRLDRVGRFDRAATLRLEAAVVRRYRE